MKSNKDFLAIIGLGYVGLPLAVAFSKKYSVIGFDINEKRISELKNSNDITLEVENSELAKVIQNNVEQLRSKDGLYVTNELGDLANANIFIVTVPTPTDKFNRPDLTPMIKASETVANFLKKGSIVIYESTVYPGVTEDEMVPILENKSGLKYNEDFFCGYSPERINPGDKEHTVTKILKITSGSTPDIAKYIDCLYKSIITAGTHLAPSIRVAEAAKVIENSQRDINIAFVNELSKIFNLLGINTRDVLEAAGTKWNFLKFMPGLVGGHCIGVDPYYLAQKAQEVGYHPEIILAGRRLNDSMGKHVASEVVKLLLRKELKVKGSNVLILGFTFKEDCPDVRNSKVIDIYEELLTYEMNVSVYDPWANSKDVKHEYGIDIFEKSENVNFNDFSAVIIAVGHSEFKKLAISKSKSLVVFDVKGILNKEFIDASL